MNTKLFIAVMKDNSRRGQLIANLERNVKETLKEKQQTGRNLKLFIMICKLILKQMY